MHGDTKPQLTLYQQALMTEKYEQELYKFFSIGCGKRCKELGRKLYLALQKKKQIKIARRRVIKVMRKIGLDKGFALKIALLLENSGLTLEEQKNILKHIKRLLLDFQRDLFTNLNLAGLNLNRLPLPLRRFILALLALKAEIVHLFRLELERQRVIREMNNLSKISMEDRNLYLNPSRLDLTNHELSRMGIALSKGDYQGNRNFYDNSQESNFQENDEYNEQESSIQFNFETNKDTRNQADEEWQKDWQYYDQEQSFNQTYKFNKDDFYNAKQAQKENKTD